MDSSPRGEALIINNKTFIKSSNLEFREGSEIDETNLKSLLEQLGFNVTLYTDLAFQDFYTKINEFARKPEHKDADMCIVVVMSHGNKENVFACDGEKLARDWIVKEFIKSNCPHLSGKPKLFVFQACKGNDLDFGVEVQTDSSQRTHRRTTSYDAKPLDRNSGIDQVTEKVPNWEDIIIASSAIPDYVSHRDSEFGTWFINCMCKVFMENACEDDLITLFNKVGKLLRLCEGKQGTKQSCSVHFIHFTEKLFFNPGLYAQDGPDGRLDDRLQGQPGEDGDSADFPLHDLNQSNAADLNNPEPVKELESEPNPEKVIYHPLLTIGTKVDKDPIGPEQFQNGNDPKANHEAEQLNQQGPYDANANEKKKRKGKSKNKSCWCC